jgi:hypothetical protein
VPRRPISSDTLDTPLAAAYHSPSSGISGSYSRQPLPPPQGAKQNPPRVHIAPESCNEAFVAHERHIDAIP